MVPEEAIEAVDALPFMIRLSVFGRFTINTSILSAYLRGTAPAFEMTVCTALRVIYRINARIIRDDSGLD